MSTPTHTGTLTSPEWTKPPTGVCIKLQTHTNMNKPLTFKTRQVGDSAYEVVMYGCYPQVVGRYATKEEAEAIAEKANSLDL